MNDRGKGNTLPGQDGYRKVDGGLSVKVGHPEHRREFMAQQLNHVTLPPISRMGEKPI